MAPTCNDAPWKLRFGAKRLRNFVDKNLSQAKRDVIAQSCFADLARVSKFTVPDELLEWVVMNIDPKLCEYRYKMSRPIVFTRGMMQRLFNLPSGDKPVLRLKKNEHSEIRNTYRDGERAPIAMLEGLLEKCADDDVVMIKRSFALLSFAIVLFVGTSNMVPLDYLGSLLDMDKAHEFAWDEAVLRFCMKQVSDFQEKRRAQLANPDAAIKQFTIGSCLPALVIVYMDHLDFPAGHMMGHTINYSLPRACFVCSADFELAMAIDRNKKTLEPNVFGKRPIKELSNTPYANIVVDAQVQVPHVAPQATHVGHQARHNPQPPPQIPEANVDVNVNLSQSSGEPSATLADWLNNSLPSSQELDIRSKFLPLYERHKVIFERELKGALSSFSRVVQTIHCSRMACLLKDVCSVAEDEAAADVVLNFDPSAAGGAGMAAGHAATHEAHTDVREEGSRVVDALDVANEVHEGEVGGGIVGATDTEEDVTVAATSAIIEFLCVPSADEDKCASADAAIEEVQGVDPVATISDQVSADVPAVVRSPTHFDLPRLPTPSRIPVSWEDVPNMELFPPGSEDYELFNSVAPLPSIAAEHPSSRTPSPNKSAGNTDLQEEQQIGVDVSSGSGVSTHDKKTRHKRVAVNFESAPKMKKAKVDADADALYTKYILHKQKTKKPAEGETYPPIIKIGSSYTSYQNWQASFKPRGDLSTEVMSVYIEHFNQLHHAARKIKKFAFSPLMSFKLSIDPAQFVSKTCMGEFNRACEDFKAHKADLLYFTIVQDHHWILVTFNMVHKQVNVFDSMKNSKNSASLRRSVTNMVINFATLVNESKHLKADIASFTRVAPAEYPQQTTHFDCGFFVILYMENWNGKVLLVFDEKYVPVFRKIVAATLFHHEKNEIDADAAIADQAA